MSLENPFKNKENFKQQLKATNPVEVLPSDALAMVKAHFNLEHLANTYRSGWLKEGRDIPKEQCESVGEHQHGMMQLAKLIRNH